MWEHLRRQLELHLGILPDEAALDLVKFEYVVKGDHVEVRGVAEVVGKPKRVTLEPVALDLAAALHRFQQGGVALLGLVHFRLGGLRDRLQFESLRYHRI